MAVDICVESYGAMMQAIDAGWLSYLSGLSARLDRMRPWQQTDSPLTDTVKQSADELPFPQAKALWLVDVCGCGYDRAAEEMDVDRALVAQLVAAGRTDIRRQIQDETAVGPRPQTTIED